jgi:hypothetical protein
MRRATGVTLATAAVAALLAGCGPMGQPPEPEDVSASLNSMASTPPPSGPPLPPQSKLPPREGTEIAPLTNQSGTTMPHDDSVEHAPPPPPPPDPGGTGSASGGADPQ